MTILCSKCKKEIEPPGYPRFHVLYRICDDCKAKRTQEAPK